MKRISFLLIAATALCFGMALAQPRAFSEPAPNFEAESELEEFDHPRAHLLLDEKLGLSAEQKEQIQKTLLDARKKNIASQAKVKIARIELHELLGVDTPDQKKIDTKIAELSQLHEATLRNRVATMLAVKNVLTPEQREKMKELRPFGERLRGRFDGQRRGSGIMGRHPMGPGHGMLPRGQKE